MNKTIKIYLGVLVLLFTAAVVIELNTPPPIDWTPSFNQKDSKPFGLKVFNEQLKSASGVDSVSEAAISPFEFIEYYNPDTSDTTKLHGCYLLIDQNLKTDIISLERLLKYAAVGNTVFLSTEHFPRILKDSLEFDTRNHFHINGKGSLYLSNEAFINDTLKMDKGASGIYFDTLEASKTTALGFQNFEQERINFVQISYGKGQFILHTQPFVFTNYYLLQHHNHNYVSNLLSYIPEKHIIFDVKDKVGSEKTSSPLRFIFSNQSLKWAWLLFLIFICTFMIFNAKRRQRVLKIIKPLENSTVQFTKTVANLYFETGNHSNITTKKMTYFFEKIRNQYQLNTNQIDQNFKNQLALKSGNSLVFIEKLIDFIVYLKSKNQHSKQELIELNHMIEKFQKKN